MGWWACASVAQNFPATTWKNGSPSFLFILRKSLSVNSRLSAELEGWAETGVFERNQKLTSPPMSILAT